MKAPSNFNYDVKVWSIMGSYILSIAESETEICETDEPVAIGNGRMGFANPLYEDKDSDWMLLRNLLVWLLPLWRHRNVRASQIPGRQPDCLSNSFFMKTAKRNIKERVKCRSFQNTYSVRSWIIDPLNQQEELWVHGTHGTHQDSVWSRIVPVTERLVICDEKAGHLLIDLYCYTWFCNYESWFWFVWLRTVH